MTIFCYGEVGFDNIIQVPHLPTPELAAFPTGDSYHIGGAAANTAVWLAGCFGVTARLSGNAIGTDLYGQQLWRWLAQHRALDLQFLQRQEGITTPFCRALVTPDAERSFLVYGYPQTPKTRLQPEMLTGCRFLALDLYGGEERLAAARVAWEAGVASTVGDVVVLDHPILPLTQIVTNSAAYIRSRFPGIDVRQHAHKLQAISRGIVITTDGADLVYVIDPAGQSFSVQPPIWPLRSMAPRSVGTTAVDATGAGDAFRAGLLAGLAQGHSLPSSVAWGVAAGTLKVGHLGAATTLPTFDEIIDLANSLT